MDNFGFDNTRLKDFTLEQHIGVLLEIELGLEQESINPKSVGLFDTPILPNLKVIQNPINGMMCFAGKMGGRYFDFEHPISEFRKKMKISQKVINMI